MISKFMNRFTVLAVGILAILLFYELMGIGIYKEFQDLYHFRDSIAEVQKYHDQLYYSSERLRTSIPHGPEEQRAWIIELARLDKSIRAFTSTAKDYENVPAIGDLLPELEQLWLSVYSQLQDIPQEMRLLNSIPPQEVLSQYIEENKDSLPRNELFALVELDYRLRSYDQFFSSLLNVYLRDLTMDILQQIEIRKSRLIWEAIFIFPLISILILMLVMAYRRREIRHNNIMDRLKDMQRLETIGRSSGRISHDLKNILGAISSYSYLAMDDLDKPEKMKETFQEIKNLTQRGKELSLSIERISREDNTPHKIVNLSFIFQELRSLMLVTLPKEIELKVDIPPKNLLIMGNPLHLFQLFMNLINNAAQAIDKYGTISLRAEPRLSYVWICVEDNGAGIDKELMDNIFNLGFTTKGETEGSGFGLYIAKEIVKEHHGEISVDSQEGEGTHFCVRLPLVSE